MLQPKVPKFSVVADVATPLTRPLWAFLNFVFFGCNILLS
jgi:hypothetical protein